MLGLDLTTGQKLQCGFVLVMVSISSYFFIRNTRPLIDGSVNAWTLPVHRHGIDKAKPVSPTNPADPTKEETVSVFICADGQLEITEYKKDPTKHPTLTFKPETRKGIQTYRYYFDPMSPVAAISDPYRHTIALAAYTVGTSGGKKTLGLLNAASLTPEQKKSEAEFRQAMLDAIKFIQVSVEQGTFHPEMMDKLLAFMAAYKDRKGDPQTDSTKADLARDVLESASQYMRKVEADKAVEIEKYITKVDTLLTADQRDAVAKAGKPYLDPQPHVVAGRGGTRGGGTRGGGGAPQRAQPSRNTARGATNRAGTPTPPTPTPAPSRGTPAPGK